MIREKRLPSRDKKRLIENIREARSRWSTYAPYLDEFRSRLNDDEDEQCVALSDVSDDTILVNSRFSLIDLPSELIAFYTLVYPSEEATERGQINVFSPLGMAVVGAQAGEIVRWTDETGSPRTAKVLQVDQQPDRDAEAEIIEERS